MVALPIDITAGEGSEYTPDDHAEHHNAAHTGKNARVNPRDPRYSGGAKADGITDDAIPLLEAIEDAQTRDVPFDFGEGGVFLTSEPLDFVATSGMLVEGAGAGGVSTPRGTIVKAAPGSGLPYVISWGAPYSHAKHIRVDGNDTAEKGWWIWDAARTHFDGIGGNNCVGDGIHVAVLFGAEHGNSNSALFNKPTAVNNTGHGLFIEEGSDNNAQTYVSPTCTGNGGDGMVIKGHGDLVLGGHMEGNGGLGVRFAELDDAGATTGCKLFFPWLEANGLGGGVFTIGKASGCEYWEITSGMQEWDFANSWTRNRIYTAKGDNNRQWTCIGDGRGIGLTYNEISVVDGSVEDVNRDLLLTPKGTGRVKPSALWVPGDTELDGALNHDGSTVGFYGTTPVAKPTVTGSRGGNAALASLLTALASQGLIVDSTTA